MSDGATQLLRPGKQTHRVKSMNSEEARRKLYDDTFLLGRFRRRSAIRELSAATDAASVIVLAEALGKNHPDAARIDAALRQLSAARDPARVLALWEYWSRSPGIPLASILAHLGWPQGQTVQEKTACDILALARQGAATETLGAVTAFARSLPADAAESNDALLGAWLRTGSEELERIVTEQERKPASPAAAVALAEALGKGHPGAARIDALLRQLVAGRDSDKVRALWEYWSRQPVVPVAAILADIGWPEGGVAQPSRLRMVGMMSRWLVRLVMVWADWPGNFMTRAVLAW